MFNPKKRQRLRQLAAPITLTLLLVCAFDYLGEDDPYLLALTALAVFREWVPKSPESED